MTPRTGLALSLAFGLAFSAHAQDSVSPLGALPGDALGVYDAAEACNAYVVDTVPLTGSWGTPLRIAPILKSTRMPGAGGYNNPILSQAISHDVPSAGFARTTYQLWSQPGAGINDQVNTPPPDVIHPAGFGARFAVAFADYGASAEGESYSGIHAAVVNLSTLRESRLYVARISAAVNGVAGEENRSQLGLGVIDSSGHLYFRADDAGVTGPNAIREDNIFRTRVLGRSCGVLNVIDNSGGSNATEWLVQRSEIGYFVPSAMPERWDRRPMYVGPNAASEYAYEVSPGVVATTRDHLQGATDHLGSFGVTDDYFLSSTVGALGAVVRPTGGGADGIALWSLRTDGSVGNARELLILPASTDGGLGTVTDNDDGFAISGGTSGWEFGGYQSQTPYRGGSGSVALLVGPEDEKLVAGTVYDRSIGGADNPSNAVVVAKGFTDWTLAGYYDATLDQGKPIRDGPGGNVIGSMTGLFKVGDGSRNGPSMSQPAFDCAGNVYFVAAAELFTDSGSEFEVVLLRAVYDPGSFSYQLELLARPGDTFVGANSLTPYQISSFPLADEDSLDSGSFFSHSVTSGCWGGIHNGHFDDPSDPRALGGLVLNALVTYDTSGDGLFDGADDEAYRAVLLITGSGLVNNCVFADCDSNDFIDTRDFVCYLNIWTARDPAADCDRNGTIDTRDFTCYLGQWVVCR